MSHPCHGVKVGFYTTLAKAEAAVLELSKSWSSRLSHEVEILSLPVRKIVPRDIAKSDFEVTWQGKLEGTFDPRYPRTGLPAANTAELNSTPRNKAYLVVHPFDYHGVNESRMMELYAFKSEEAASRTVSALSTNLPRDSFGYLELPVDGNPSGHTFDYHVQ